MLLATAACNFSTSQLQKVVRACSVLYILTSKCASRYSGVQFFHIATSKSGPNLVCFSACNFATSQLEKVVRTRQFFNILTSKCSSRYSGVQFSHIATSKSGPSMPCFVHFAFKMCFSLQRRAFFHIATSKSGPNLVRFVHFDLKMRFSLQRRSIFHVSSQQLPPRPPL